MNRPHRYNYKFSDDPELEKIERCYFGKNTIYWQHRTAIFHYSNGTNRCCIEGCDAEVHQLTLEHELFNRLEVSKQLGIIANRGYDLAVALINAGFPDMDITVKCFMHNIQNTHPQHKERISRALVQPRPHIDPEHTKVCMKCGIEKKSNEFALNRTSKDGLARYCSYCSSIQHKARANKATLKAYRLLGWQGKEEDIKDYSFSHTFNDGNKHRRYLQTKYRLKKMPGGWKFAEFLIKEYESGVTPWPGLKVEKLNAQMDYKKRTTFYDSTYSNRSR